MDRISSRWEFRKFEMGDKNIFCNVCELKESESNPSISFKLYVGGWWWWCTVIITSALLLLFLN